MTPPISDRVLLSYIRPCAALIEEVKAFSRRYRVASLWEANDCVTSKYGITGMYIGYEDNNKFAPHINYADGKVWDWYDSIIFIKSEAKVTK